MALPEQPIAAADEPGEEVDAVLVADARPLPASRPTGQVVMAQAAVVATSFAAGAATAVVLARRGRRAGRRAARGRGRARHEIAASRSFLVDVHLLNR